MVMTDEQKYSAVLKELGELLQSKNTTISCQRWQIDELKAKLEAAEKEREEACNKENALGNGETYYLLDREAINALRNANTTLLECFNRMVSHGDCSAYVEILQNVQRSISSALPVNGGAA